MTEINEKTFVFDSKEWVLTGRIAKKPIYHVRDVNRIIANKTIVEIAPMGIGREDSSFFRWVDPRDLYYITESDDINIDELKENNNKGKDNDDNN
jgi:hypothetical protein